MFVVLLVVPMVYSLPISMLTAEMATALPEGGMVDWIVEACGPTLGAHTTYWIWITYVFDAAIYPVLAGEYIGQEIDFSWAPGGNALGQNFFVILLITLVTLIKVVGMDVFVKFSTVLAALSLFPIALYLGFGLPKINFNGIDNFSGDYECNITTVNSSQHAGNIIEVCRHEDADFSQV